jgi:hypothetical protein
MCAVLCRNTNPAFKHGLATGMSALLLHVEPTMALQSQGVGEADGVWRLVW